MFYIISLCAGLLFGMGMVISGMIIPENVIQFLDVYGHWSPNLAFVMGGALLIFLPFYFLVITKTQPVCVSDYSLPNNRTVDKKLIIGASLFGIGWGIAGICPGPVVSSLSAGGSDLFIFLISLMLGLKIGGVIVNR